MLWINEQAPEGTEGPCRDQAPQFHQENPTIWGLRLIYQVRSEGRPTSAKLKTTDLPTSQANASSPMIFTNLEDLFGLLDATADDCLEVNQVSADNFRAIEERRDYKGCHYRFFYEHQTALLLITIPISPHEVMHSWLASSVDIKADAMGLRAQLIPTNSTTYRSTSSGVLEISLEGDSSRSLNPRTTPNRWPVLIIEAGYSQTIQQLRMRARAWFLSSNFEVKIVVLAKMLVSERRIVLEKWKGIQVGDRTGIQAGDRTGSPRTRSEHRRTPQCVHIIEISHPDAGEEPHSVSPESYRVTRGALRLDFEELFLRSPVGEDEADIIITEEELQLYASVVWDVAG